MIDFHSHILPAIDDGAINVDESIAMARNLVDFGFTTVCCTPHCLKGYYDLTPQKVREATLMLQADLDNAGINLALWPGTEYMLDEYLGEYADDLLPLGETKLVLCEAPQQAHPGVVQQGLELIIDKGYVPLIAHPERTQHFYDMLSSFRDAGRGTRDEENLVQPKSLFPRIWPFATRVPRPAPLAPKPIKEPKDGKTDSGLPEGVLFQANLGSFTGYYGEQVQRRAYELLKAGVYTALASDLHDSRSSSQVLVRDKIEMNPILQKLAEFDGSLSGFGQTVGGGPKGQVELF